MSKTEEIANKLKELTMKLHTNTIGVVKSVSENEGICAVELDTDVVLGRVRLSAVISELTAPFLLIPVVGSYVGIEFVEKSDTQAYISKYTEVAKIQMRSGEFGGLVQVANLTTKLNHLVSQVNTLIQKFNTHTHVVATTGTAAAQSGTAAVTLNTATNADNFNKTDFENTLITHG